MTGRRQIAVALLVLAGVFGVGAALKLSLGNELAPVGVGARAPEFEAMTIDETPVKKSLDDYKGSVVLLNIWATWCAPCRVEMPNIERLHQAYAARGLKVIAVSVDDAGMQPQIRSFVKEYGLTFEVLHDAGGQEGKIARDYQTAGYPETVIIGRDGLIRKKMLGAHDWNSPANRRLIEDLLARRPE